MKTLLRRVINNPLVAVLALIIITLAGAWSAFHMPVDLFPSLEVPVVNVITHYPAAAPEDLELLVTQPVESEMRGIPGVRRVASISAQGISQVTVEFTWGTTVRDDARQLVQAGLARARGALPSGVTPRLENIGTTLQEVAGYMVYGGGDLITLRNIVRHDLAGRLMAVEGVSSVDVLGGDRRAFIISVKPEDLSRLSLTVGDIAALLRESNLTAVAGYLDRSSREYLIRGDARLRTLADIRSLPVISDREQTVSLGSIASVYKERRPAITPSMVTGFRPLPS